MNTTANSHTPLGVVFLFFQAILGKGAMDKFLICSQRRSRLWKIKLVFFKKEVAHIEIPAYIAKTKYRNKYPQKRDIGVSAPISTFMRLWAIYIFPRSVCLFCWRKCVDRSWDYINRSQTRECWNWGWGRAIPRKGIHKWYFRCSVRLKMLEEICCAIGIRNRTMFSLCFNFQ